MTEKYTQNDSEINSYDSNNIIASENVNSNFENIDEGFSDEKAVDEEISKEEEKNIIESMTEVEKESYEGINVENEKIINLALSENPIISRAATYAVIGSAFSNAPSSEKELEEMPIKNKLISNKFKILAASILFSVMPLVSEAQHKQDKKDAEIVNVFDESTERMAKQIFGWHKKEKELFIALETKRKLLYQELENINTISLKTESEKSHYRMLETERDAKLSQVELRRAKFNKELMNSDMNDLKVLAEAEAKTKEFEYQRAVIIEDFEKSAEKFFMKKSADEVRAIENEIRKITQMIDKMVNYRIRDINRTSAFTFY